MDSETEARIDRVWTAIEHWYAEHGAAHLLNGPATAAEIDELERALGLSIPAAWRSSLSRHNGSTDIGWPRGELLSTTGVVEEVNVWRGLLADGSFDGWATTSSSDALQPGWWNLGWASLDADGGGNGAVVDLAPGPAGRSGQVIDMDHETGPSGPVAADVIAYLEAVLEELPGFRVVDDSLEELE